MTATYINEIETVSVAQQAVRDCEACGTISLDLTTLETIRGCILRHTPTETVWTIHPHTEAKHELLRRHLSAYYPKLASTYDRIEIIDGFAGPGIYTGGEFGSPIIALNTLTNHNGFNRWQHRKFNFTFIEQDCKRYATLRDILSQRNDPPNVSVVTHHGSFQEHIQELLPRLRTAPSFIMVDPFGVADIPLELLKHLARIKKSELLISFMYKTVHRFLSAGNFAEVADRTFGTNAWRTAQSMSPDDKQLYLSGLYEQQLNGIGMQYVRLFDMRDIGGRTEYYLAFATHHLDGLEVFKNAMWKVDKLHGRAFSDVTNVSVDQPILLGLEPNLAPLKLVLFKQFAGCENIPIDEIDTFVLAETAFTKPHGKTVLRECERDQMVTVTRPAGKRKNYWNKGTSVTFGASG